MLAMYIKVLARKVIASRFLTTINIKSLKTILAIVVTQEYQHI